MRKILSVLLVICMITIFVTGCSDKAETVTDEQLIKQVVTDYVNSVYAFDFDKTLETVAKDTVLYSSVEQMKQTYSVDGLVDEMFSQLEIPVEYKEDITIIIKNWIVRMMKNSKLEFINTDIKGDNATVYIKTSTPDLTVFGEILQNYDKYITEDQVEQLMQKYLVSLDEDTKWDLIIEVLPVVLTAASKDVEYIDSETNIILEKFDDKWLIMSDEQ